MALEAEAKLELAAADFRAVAALRPGGNSVAAERVRRLERKLSETVTIKASSGTETRVALLIGNAGYTKVAPLTNAKRDTQLLAGSAQARGLFRRHTAGGPVARTTSRRTSWLCPQGRARGLGGCLLCGSWHRDQRHQLSHPSRCQARIGSRCAFRDDRTGETRRSAVEGARKLRLVILDACRDNPFNPTMKRNGFTLDRPWARGCRAGWRDDGGVRREGGAGLPPSTDRREQSIRHSACKAHRYSRSGSEFSVPQSARRSFEHDGAPAGAVHLRLAPGPAVLFPCSMIACGYRQAMRNTTRAPRPRYEADDGCAPHCLIGLT